MATTQQQEDLAAWKAWKASPTPQNTERLINLVMPLLGREVSHWSTLAPKFLLMNEAKRIALEAFQTFDPSRGVLLSTHIMSRLQKLSRLAYERQSTLTVPEHQRLAFNTVDRVKRQLEEEHGMPPSMAAIADRMSITPDKLHQLLQTVGKTEFLTSADTGPGFAVAPDNGRVLDLAYHDMTPLQKKIFEYRTGYNGAVRKNGAQICKELGITQGQLSYQLENLQKLLQKAKNSLGV